MAPLAMTCVTFAGLANGEIRTKSRPTFTAVQKHSRSFEVRIKKEESLM